MKKNVLLLIFFIGLMTQTSVAETLQCFQIEEDPKRLGPYSTQLQYQLAKDEWRDETPGLSNPIELAFAYRVYRIEKNKAEALGIDKTAHCFIGCRVAQETSLQTAAYVGWLKEQRDLGDCKAESHFDKEDYLATIKGALMAATLRTGADCADSCIQVYPKNNF
ncbi:MAG: hypothetical protein IPM97_12850 [Bdellovibrionaceae bacterium]|nr:hypothetical protein [Pseudobdellovibrionaceae bacterium]